jgi:hypothetical protein
MGDRTHERLNVCAEPRAQRQLVETQPPLLPEGVKVERFVTAHGAVFERHTADNEVVTWYRVIVQE